MNLTHLRYFQQIARSGTLTAAARELSVSQPTLSVSIQQLEEQLNTTLLLRDRRGVQLTTTGRELLHYANEVFLLIEQATVRIQGLEADEIGQFTLGCPDVLGAYFLPKLMARLVQEMPKVELTLWNGPSHAVYQAILRRDVHFGLIVNPLPHPDLVLVELFNDATALFVEAKSHQTIRRKTSDEQRRSLDEARLREGPLIYVEGLPQSQEIRKQLGQQDLLPKRQIPCGTYELVKSLLLENVGVALIPERVAAYRQEGKLLRLHPSLPFVHDTIYLVYRGDHHRTHAAKRIREALVAHSRTLQTVD